MTKPWEEGTHLTQTQLGESEKQNTPDNTYLLNQEGPVKSKRNRLVANG